jgi:hypothetical protein
MNTVNKLSASNTKPTQSLNKKSTAVGGSLGFKNVLILFFSAMAVSLVILVLFFGLFFQKVDFSLNTKPLNNASPTIIDPEAPVPDEAQNGSGLTDNQLQDVFSEININVPTDAYKMGKPTNGSAVTPAETIVKTKPTDAYVGVGTPPSATGSTSGESESASDVQVETAPPLPQVPSKTAPVAPNNGSSNQTEESSSEPDLMPMAPVPGGGQ